VTAKEKLKIPSLSIKYVDSRSAFRRFLRCNMRQTPTLH